MSSISSGALIIPSLDRGTPASEERRHQFRHFRLAIRCPPSLPPLLLGGESKRLLSVFRGNGNASLLRSSYL